MKNSLLNLSVCVAMIMACLSGRAIGDTKCPLPLKEVEAIETFFKEFKEAFNAKDAEKVKHLSGNNWNDWARNIKRGVKIECLEILDIVTDEVTNVVTKTTAIETNGKRSSPEIVFTLVKHDGAYSIEKMAVPKVDKRNQEFDAAVKTKEMLIDAINARDMDVVKSLLSFNEAKNFEVELSSRGLMWIKSAIVNGVVVPLEDSGVGREREDLLIGRVCVPCSPGGTNVLRRFIFKDGKIDRAAPRKETKEEFMKRFEAEKEKSRKEREAREAAEQKKLAEEALERTRSKYR